MRKSLLILFFLSGLFVRAQDKMITLTRDTILCDVLDINNIAITYKILANASSFHKSGSEIYKVVFADGRVQVVNE